MKHLALSSLVLAFCGCMEGAKPAPLPRAGAVPDSRPPLAGIPHKRSLYERLGGYDAIAKVVHDFVGVVVADDRIRAEHKKHFMDKDVGALEKKLVDQIGEATGGPEKYTGKDMKTAHKGLDITNADFDALMDDLAKALQANKVPPMEQEEVKALLAPLRGQVVERP